MIIQTQDRDTIFTLTDKGLYSRIYVKEVSWKGTLIAFNVMGKTLFKETVLGTYDEDTDAEQVVKEIYRMLKLGVKFYSMPELGIEQEELEGML